MADDGTTRRGIGAAERALVEAGCSLVVGTVGADGAPRATRAWAATVLDEAAGRLRVVVTADDAVALANLGTGQIAVTGADVRTLRAVQLKGHVVVVEPATPGDLATLDEHTGRFFQAVHETDGNPVELLRRLLPHEVVAVELVVEEVYDQSPGPGAGAALAPRGAAG